MSKALEAEFQGMEAGERDFEMARRLVQLSGTAAKQAALASPGTDPVQAAKAAVAHAARLHVPSPSAAFPVFFRGQPGGVRLKRADGCAGGATSSLSTVKVSKPSGNRIH